MNIAAHIQINRLPASEFQANQYQEPWDRAQRSRRVRRLRAYRFGQHSKERGRALLQGAVACRPHHRPP